jgi:hypothetical protein
MESLEFNEDYDSSIGQQYEEENMYTDKMTSSSDDISSISDESAYMDDSIHEQIEKFIYEMSHVDEIPSIESIEVQITETEQTIIEESVPAPVESIEVQIIETEQTTIEEPVPAPVESNTEIEIPSSKCTGGCILI